MKKNKGIVFCILICLVSYTSCYEKGRMVFASREMMNLVVAKKIINFISEQDAAGLKDLFSEEVVSSDFNLEKDIKKLLAFCNGQITHYEKVASKMGTTIEGRQNSTEFYTEYRFFMNQIPYLLYYIYTPKNSFDPKKIGVRSLKIVKEEDDDKYFCYWQKLKQGVFVPEPE